MYSVIYTVMTADKYLVYVFVRILPLNYQAKQLTAHDNIWI